MKSTIPALKAKFREGRHAQAIAECEALCRAEPSNFEARQLCGSMHALTRNFARAVEVLEELHARDPRNGDVLFNLGMCQRELGNFGAAASHFAKYAQEFPAREDGRAALKECHEALLRRGEQFEAEGKLEQAAAEYRAALTAQPRDEAALRKATLCLLQLDRGDEAIQVCRDVLKAWPESVAARLGAEWLLSQMVPLWHVPMMNEEERNRPYHEALKASVTQASTVFEVGTGSGLLSMMAARLGAKKVYTCEAVRIVAATASKIVERNGLQDQVTVLSKPSYQVRIGQDLPGQADILLHEVFSSELLGEHVLPAIEDAKARLLKPGGLVLPGSASIMIALVGGAELGKELHVQEAFGFDLSPFNDIYPKKRPLHREDLPRELLCADAEAFRFDFQNQAGFPAETKRIDLQATKGGTCWGVIQWVRLDFGGGVLFENHPTRRRALANWQQNVYRFDTPLQVQPGQVVSIAAMHDRTRPWFELAAGK